MSRCRDEIGVAIIDRAGEHAHPGLNVCSTIGDGDIFDKLFEVAIWKVLDYHVDVLVLGREDVKEGYNGSVGKVLAST